MRAMVGPMRGIVTLGFAFLMMPVAHVAYGLLAGLKPFGLGTWALAMLSAGFLGVTIMWAGLKYAGLKASLAGFIAGHLMFLGFFELCFGLFGKLLAIAPVVSEKTGRVILTPGLQMNAASFLIAVPLFLLVFTNANTRCNMVLWLRRKLRLNPGAPTEPPQGRQLSRIVAHETIFIIWMIYSLSLLLLDPRILGATHWLSMTIYTFFLAWPLYLTWRLFKLDNPGTQLRYAIPIAVLYWSWVEMFAAMDAITEFYLHPFVYPLANTILVALCIALGIWLWVGERTPADPSGQHDTAEHAG